MLIIRDFQLFLKLLATNIDLDTFFHIILSSNPIVVKHNFTKGSQFINSSSFLFLTVEFSYHLLAISTHIFSSIIRITSQLATLVKTKYQNSFTIRKSSFSSYLSKYTLFTTDPIVISMTPTTLPNIIIQAQVSRQKYTYILSSTKKNK